MLLVVSWSTYAPSLCGLLQLRLPDWKIDPQRAVIFHCRLSFYHLHTVNRFPDFIKQRNKIQLMSTRDSTPCFQAFQIIEITCNHVIILKFWCNFYTKYLTIYYYYRIYNKIILIIAIKCSSNLVLLILS